MVLVARRDSSTLSWQQPFESCIIFEKIVFEISKVNSSIMLIVFRQNSWVNRHILGICVRVGDFGLIDCNIELVFCGCAILHGSLGTVKLVDNILIMISSSWLVIKALFLERQSETWLHERARPLVSRNGWFVGADVVIVVAAGVILSGLLSCVINIVSLQPRTKLTSPLIEWFFYIGILVLFSLSKKIFCFIILLGSTSCRIDPHLLRDCFRLVTGWKFSKFGTLSLLPIVEGLDI